MLVTLFDCNNLVTCANAASGLSVTVIVSDKVFKSYIVVVSVGPYIGRFCLMQQEKWQSFSFAIGGFSHDLWRILFEETETLNLKDVHRVDIVLDVAVVAIAMMQLGQVQWNRRCSEIATLRFLFVSQDETNTV